MCDTNAVVCYMLVKSIVHRAQNLDIPEKNLYLDLGCDASDSERLYPAVSRFVISGIANALSALSPLES